MEGAATVETAGHRTRILERGVGSPVVVLHGWGGRIESMAPVIACLEPAFSVVAIDLPGFGESPPPAGAWGTPDYAEFVRDVLASKGIERAHFVGHSFGAKTAFYLAAVHPDMVDRLVLAGSSGLKRPPTAAARLKKAASQAGRFAGRLGPAGRAVRDALYAGIASQDYRDAGPMRPTMVKVVNEDLRGVLPRIRASTLLVWGGRDDAVPVGVARTMEQLIPDAGLVVFDDAGHFVYLDEQDRFCRVVRHFLGAPAD